MAITRTGNIFNSFIGCRRGRWLCLLLLVTSSWPLAASQVLNVNKQDATTALVSALLPEQLLHNESYKLDETARVYRGVAVFEMYGDYGPATLVGREGVLERIDELAAIKKLQAMKNSEVYKSALKSSAQKPVEIAKNLVDEPKEALRDIGRGLGSFFSDIGYSIVSDDPNQENVAKTAIGFAAAKRQLAYGLGISPYSTFKPLQDELSEVAWTAVGGGLTVSMGFRAIGGAGGSLLATSGTAESMRGLVRDNSPRALQNINYEKLLAMGVEEPLAEVMLNNFNYDPENETRLIGALASMEGVAGRALFIQRAALQDQPYNARLMREWAELFADYHRNVQRVKAIIVSRTAPQLVLADATTVALFPADYITAGPGFARRNAENIASLRSLGYVPGEAWVTGKIDPAVRQGLLDSGWQKLVEDAQSRVSVPQQK